MATLGKITDQIRSVVEGERLMIIVSAQGGQPWMGDDLVELKVTMKQMFDQW